jgi:hypothetical protein
MNKMRFITLFATIAILSGCMGGSAITIKDATGLVAGQVISNATDSDAVIVKDARIKKNWNSDATTNPTANPTTNPTTNPIPTQPTDDKTATLYWFFFSMMLMGMLGAGLIGIIEAFSGKDSLSTEQAVRTAPIPTTKPRVKLNKDGITTDV